MCALHSTRRGAAAGSAPWMLTQPRAASSRSQLRSRDPNRQLRLRLPRRRAGLCGESGAQRGEGLPPREGVGGAGQDPPRPAPPPRPPPRPPHLEQARARAGPGPAARLVLVRLRRLHGPGRPGPAPPRANARHPAPPTPVAYRQQLRRLAPPTGSLACRPRPPPGSPPRLRLRRLISMHDPDRPGRKRYPLPAVRQQSAPPRLLPADPPRGPGRAHAHAHARPGSLAAPRGAGQTACSAAAAAAGPAWRDVPAPTNTAPRELPGRAGPGAERQRAAPSAARATGLARGRAASIRPRGGARAGPPRAALVRRHHCSSGKGPGRLRPGCSKAGAGAGAGLELCQARAVCTASSDARGGCVGVSTAADAPARASSPHLVRAPAELCRREPPPSCRLWLSPSPSPPCEPAGRAGRQAGAARKDPA